MEKEIRYYPCELRIERREDGTAVIEGHAAVFNSLSENLGGFREQIDKGAFDDVLQDDVRALFNHDPNLILARSPKTLSLGVDERGLTFKYESPDTTYARDLLISIERGDISQASFGFRVAQPDGAEWIEDDESGAVTRRVKKLSRLFDVSPVTFPAYPQTDVAKRSLDSWKDEKEEKEKRRARLALYRNKLKLNTNVIKNDN